MTAALHLIAGLALFGAVQAASQRPSPAAGKAGEPQQADTARAKQPAAENQRGTEQAPLIVKVIPPTKTQAETAEQAKDREEKAANDRKLVDFTRWLVVATLILAGVAFFQLIVFGLQARHLRQTVNTMEDTAERQLRAYLSRSGKPAYEQISEVNAGTTFTFKVPIKNTGQTPAYNVVARGRAVLLPRPQPLDADLTLPTVTSSSVGTLGSDEKLSVPCGSDRLVDGEVTAMTGGKWTLFVVGEVTYLDAFRHQRRTRFCEGITWQDGGNFTNYTADRHNDAD